MYRPHREPPDHRYWFTLLRGTSSQRDERDLEWKDDERAFEYDRPGHRRAVSFDEGRSAIRFLSPAMPRRLTPLRNEQSLPSAIKKIAAAPDSPTDSTKAEAGSSRALTIHVEAPRGGVAKAKEKRETKAMYLPPLLSLRDWCREYHLGRDIFTKLERMGVKGPASLQYIDYEYLQKPEGVFYKGREVEGLMPPEMSEVKVAMERWEVGVGAKGRIVR